MGDNQLKLPAVVRHVKKNKIGVAFRRKMLGNNEYYSVSAIRPTVPGESTWAAWGAGVCQVVMDMSPEDLGWQPKMKMRRYMRNTLTGAVAIAYGQTWRYDNAVWLIERPDGRRSTRWDKRYSEEITKAEYDEADKTIGHDALNRNAQYRRRAEKAKPGHDRTCRMCGRSCWPNWFYCPACHGAISSEHDWGPENEGAISGI